MRRRANERPGTRTAARSRRRRHAALPTIAFGASIGVVSGVPGCATEPAPAPDAIGGLVAPASGPAIATLDPLGTVPYDGLVLPILSPDATFAATHYGAAPTWPAILGAPGATPPELTAVRVYSISQRGAKSVATVTEAVVLGRGADGEGFLVEAPREDGARWIGRVPWASRGTASPDWLVADGHVNALATLGPDGALAWCRRAPDQDRFSITLRRGDRTAIVPRGEDESWLLPSFSADGARLFAMVLRGTDLLLASLPVDSLSWRDAPAPHEGTSEDDYSVEITAAAMSDETGAGGPDGVRLHPLASDCTVETAWQCLAFAQGWPVEAARPQGTFVFFHPAHRRLALWNAIDGGLALMPAGSLAGAFIDPRTIVLALPGRVVVQGLSIAAEGRTGSPPRPLAEGLHLPRGTAADATPIVLLAPQRGDVRLAAVRMAGR